MAAADAPGSVVAPSALLRLQWRPYRFALPQAMVTSQGAWQERRGWLLRLEAADGRLGWGEAALSPLETGSGAAVQDPLRLIQPPAAGLRRQSLELLLPALPAPFACAVGMALAELDGLGAAERGGWRPAPPAAHLLPAGDAMLTALAAVLNAAAALHQPPCVKWKVAAGADRLERALLEQLLERLPPGSRLRLDANGGWDRSTAAAWAERLVTEPRLEWLEQPLPPGDQAGLEALQDRLPVALDESLRQDPSLQEPGAWRGWQVRRPLLEGDPRPLLAALQAGTPRLMLSTALETGFGRRLLNHLAALQVDGPTPAAPGLAPGWRPDGALFAGAPERVWEAAA